MKSYRTYRYGWLPFVCICDGVKKRDKETKRMVARRWGINGRFNANKMRKGSMR